MNHVERLLFDPIQSAVGAEVMHLSALLPWLQCSAELSYTAP